MHFLHFPLPSTSYLQMKIILLPTINKFEQKRLQEFAASAELCKFAVALQNCINQMKITYIQRELSAIEINSAMTSHVDVEKALKQIDG